MGKQQMGNHVLVPKHERLSKKDAEKLLEQYNIAFHQLPQILVTDAALEGLEAQPGDVIKITRKSPTSGTSVYYRGVISE